MPGPIVAPPTQSSPNTGSPNKAIIDTFVAALQKKVDPQVLYNALTKIETDLQNTYDALFDGPLPAVDGYYLTRLNAAVLNGPFPASYNLAYTNIDNMFSHGQSIIEDDDTSPFLTFGFGDLIATPGPVVNPLSYFRLGATADEEFFITQNLLFDGTDWGLDNSLNGASLLQFINGAINYSFYDSTLPGMRAALTFYGREIASTNFLQTGAISIAALDANDVVRLGNSADGDGVHPDGWPALIHAATTDFPASGNPNCDGVVGIDSTLHKLVYYVNGLRYAILGIAF